MTMDDCMKPHDRSRCSNNNLQSIQNRALKEFKRDTSYVLTSGRTVECLKPVVQYIHTYTQTH